MNKTVKLLSSLVCIIALLLSIMSPCAYAAQSKCDCDMLPVVTVRGFGSVLSDENGATVYPMQTDKTLSGIPFILLSGMLMCLGQNELASESMNYALDCMVGGIRCDKNGNSLKKLHAPEISPTDVDTHKIEGCLLTVPEDAEKGDYTFEYDWRLDPIYNAELLSDYIKQVKKVTGHDKIIICAHSEGTCVVSAYIAKHDTSDIEKIVFLNGAYSGMTLIGKVFTRDISLKNNGGALRDFISTFMGNKELTDFMSVLNYLGILNPVLNIAQLALNMMLDKAYDGFLIDLFATMPGLWSFVPDECYEEAKMSMFKGNSDYSGLIEKLDNYHYNVQSKLNENLIKISNDGVAVAVVTGYGIAPIPAYDGAKEQCDMLIDTKYASLGATCAPMSETLSKTEGKYLSPDGLVDASTCLFPYSTWFIRYQSHNDFCQPYGDFLYTLIRFKGQPTVETLPGYSQFMTCDGHERLVSASQLPLRK